MVQNGESFDVCIGNSPVTPRDPQGFHSFCGNVRGVLGRLTAFSVPHFLPVHITTPINVTDHSHGTTSDPLHLVKRQAVGALSFESFAIRPDGTMICGDELAPANGNAGGGLYKFVPALPFAGGAPITVPAESPLASGTIYGLRVAASGSSNWGQGAEVGKGAWTPVNLAGANASTPRAT